MIQTHWVYVTDPDIEAWIQVHRSRIWDATPLGTYKAGDWDGQKARQKAVEPLSGWSVHAEGVRAFRAIVAAQRARQDRATDRLLAKRTDALGNLYHRAPKRERKAAA